ncbi:hypothetical protein I7G59_06490 [Sinorhizobium meliloti]|uniref:hypothetical protein n=1 Tax=Rhizobium meliloti TaxID=382 RepID=UPI002380ACEB|nr:hypothetical protein [Sinorhizobium meliloti]MDE3796982.1 hypothetical protein [Sinorhizobium meliloti]
MADLVITSSSVVSGAGARIEHGTAGATITAGQALYLDSAVTGKWQLADNNSATAAVRTPRGIALNSASLNQPIAVQTEGPITIGAALTAGVAYYLSDTPGGICPVADLLTGEYPTVLGLATSTTVLDIDIQSAGVAL